MSVLGKSPVIEYVSVSNALLPSATSTCKASHKDLIGSKSELKINTEVGAIHEILYINAGVCWTSLIAGLPNSLPPWHGRHRAKNEVESVPRSIGHVIRQSAWRICFRRFSRWSNRGSDAYSTLQAILVVHFHRLRIFAKQTWWMTSGCIGCTGRNAKTTSMAVVLDRHGDFFTFLLYKNVEEI